MKALWLREVQAIVERADFIKWWQSLLELEKGLSSVRDRHVELLAQVNLMMFRAEFTQKNAIDSLYLAGEYEDAAAQALAQASEIENKSYEAVANFESQRIAVSDLFSKMGAVEHKFLKSQEEVQRLTAALRSSKDGENQKELERQIKHGETERTRMERELREASAIYERGNSRKMSLWEEVEQMWARSLDINLGVSERRVKGKRARREAEGRFKEAEQYKGQAQALRQEAQEANQKVEEIGQAIEELRTSARRLWDCIVGEEFLYWPRRENIKEVYCVPLGDHAEEFNIELAARSIYLVNRQRGVEFLKVLPPAGEVREDEDERIDDFFDREDQAAPEGS